MSEPTIGPTLEYATMRPGESLQRSGPSIGADSILQLLTTGAAVIVILMLVALVAILFRASLPSIHQYGAKFLVSSDWRPNELEVPKKDANGNVVIEDGEVVTEKIPPAFGALPTMYGTAVSSLVALILAVPLSFGVALFLIRIAPSASGLAIKMTLAAVLILVSVFLIAVNKGVAPAVISLVLLPFAVAAAIAVRWANQYGKHGHYLLQVASDILNGLLGGIITYGILDHILKLGTLGIVASMLVGLLGGLGSAYYARRIGDVSSFLVEFLAAIPSIAYGMWGLFVLAPFLQNYLEKNLGALYFASGQPAMFRWLFQQTQDGKVQDLALTGRDMFCGGVVLAIMIVPIITAIARDVLRSVPRSQIEGTVALGATWWQTSKEMLRYSRAGLFGAVMLGLARAAGETMAVTLVIGNNSQIRASLFAPAQTMSSLLANEFAEASSDIHRSALTEVALILLVMSLAFNVIARYLVVGKSSRSAAAA
jgi:phosphate transport system permease protein